MTSPTQPEVSAERREQAKALWAKLCRPYTPSSLFPFGATDTGFDDFIAALDAQAKAKADIRVEAMRLRAKATARSVKESCERSAKIHRPPYAAPNEEIAMAHESGAAIAQQIEDLIRAMPIEGDGR